ncbi:MAG TPA: hypothetical protein VKB80_37350 [Kofleriaceae bacterium]|nr:hypothetical protein [Kofleriaceae bacterium]
MGRAEGDILLGHVTVPSGIVLLIDGGMLGAWSHDRRPALDERVWGAHLARAADTAVDLIARGADAITAVRLFNRASGRPPYVFDVPQAAVAETVREFAAVADEHGLDARLEPAPERVPHRRRAAALLEATPGVAQVPFCGMWAVACEGVPSRARLPVAGRRMPEGSGYDDWWQSVWLELSDAEVTSAVLAASVLVDRARLMFADVDAVGSWKDVESLDGLVDVVFWGRDAGTAATESGAARLGLTGEAQSYGWIDLDAARARDAHMRLEMQQARGRRFAIDVRPHSHSYQLLARAGASPTQSGEVEIGGAVVCGFATTWGDGAFDVYRDLAADGSLARLRIEMGTAERVAMIDREEEDDDEDEDHGVDDRVDHV